MRILLLVPIIALAESPCAAQDFELEFTEQSLNHLVGQLGGPGKGGIYQVNALSALGYSGCQALGRLECPDGNSTPMGQQGTASPIVRNIPTTNQQAKAPPLVHLSLCRGPNGKSVIVPGHEPVYWQWWITKAHFTILA